MLKPNADAQPSRAAAERPPKKTPPKSGKAKGLPQKPALSPFSIGTRNESSLHRALKFHYSGSGGEMETQAGNYVCDARTSSGELIEVQTGSFGPLKEKIKNLSLSHKVRIIHPVSLRKTIEVYDAEGGFLYTRKSPKKGSPWDLFTALVYAPELPLLKNLTIELALVDVAEKRINDGKGSWRRRGIRIADRSIMAWHDSIILKKPADYCRFIPAAKGESFTVKEYGKKAGINERVARRALYVLTKMGLAKRVGKRKNAIVYERVN